MAVAAVYEGRESRWVESVTADYPDLDLVLGEIINCGHGEVIWVPTYANSCTWDDRIAIHRKIVTACSRVDRHA